MNKKVLYMATGTLTAAMLTTAMPEIASVIPMVGITQNAYADQKTDVNTMLKYEEDGDEITITGFAGVSSRIVIPSTIDGKTVTAIGGEAFKGNKNIGEVVLPETVTTIGQSAFKQSSLTKIVIPATVTKYGDWYGTYDTFNGCSIESLEIHTKTIPENGFRSCKSLKTVILGDEVEEIKGNAFYDCTALESVSGGVNVVSIGGGAFEGAASMKQKFNYPNVEFIGNKAFHGTGITEAVIPASLTTWGDWYGHYETFEGCSIESLEIHTEIIPDSAFQGCKQLKTVKLGEEVKKIKTAAFKECSSLVSVLGGDSVISVSESAFEGDASMKQKFNYPNVEFIGHKAFAGSGLTEVELPESVTEFGDWYGHNEAFKDCDNLTKVVSNVKISLPEEIFANCDSLTTVIFEQSGYSVLESAFSGCKALTNVRFSGTETYIGPNAFYGCSSLKNVILPTVIRELGPGAFEGCAIEEIYIPSGTLFNDSWGNANTFKGCPIKNITIGYSNIGSKNGIINSAKSSAVIYSVKGDDAEGFAKDNGYKFTEIKNIPLTSIEFNHERYNIKTGEAIMLEPVLTPANAIDYYKWTVGDSSVISVDPDGYVRGKKPGITVVQVETTGGKKAVCTIVVDDEVTTTEEIETVNDLTLGYIAAIPTQNYTGSAIQPDVRVMFNDTVRLIPGVDYTATYSNNVEGGVASVTVVGRGRFEGKLTANFYINPFKDVKLGQYYTDSILYLNNKAVMTGLNKTTFGFGKLLSREDMVVLLWKNEGKPSMNVTTNVFKDIAPKKYYTDAVSWAKKNNISSGYTSGAKAGCFGKGDTITRQDFIKIIYGYAKFKGYDTSVKSASSYTAKSDSSKVSKYARESMNWAYEKGFIGNGAPLNPKGNIKRQDAAVIIARFLQAYDK